MNNKIFGGIVGAAAALSQTAQAKDLETVLNLRENVTMESLAASVLNPHSPNYGRVFSPSEIRAIAAPSDADYAQLLKTLRQEGFTVVSESKTHLMVTVRAPKELVESTFSTQIRFLNSDETLMMNERPPTVPARLDLVQSVSGLDNTRQAHPHLIKQNVHAMSSGSLSPATVKTMYGFNAIYAAGITGKGQHIAIAGYDDITVSDTQQYFRTNQISPAPTVDKVVFNGKPATNDSSATESEMDVEFSGMIAPGAAIHYFGSSQNNDAGEVQLFTAILDDNRAKVVNYSWGSCEPQLTAAHQADMMKIFARAVAQGVNIMVASGDSGSNGCSDGKVAADYPASAPYVVAVGGTSASTQNGLTETAWNGSGGGISALFALPDYQSSLGGPYVRRSFPDVAFNADPNTGEAAVVPSGWFFPQTMVIGGTSIAAPQWSGFMALVGQARASKSALGFLNPHIYGLPVTTQMQVFHDVTSGNNGAYQAGAGWDAVTGWGSMRASTLLNFLVSL